MLRHALAESSACHLGDAICTRTSGLHHERWRHRRLDPETSRRFFRRYFTSDTYTIQNQPIISRELRIQNRGLVVKITTLQFTNFWPHLLSMAESLGAESWLQTSYATITLHTPPPHFTPHHHTLHHTTTLHTSPPHFIKLQPSNLDYKYGRAVDLGQAEREGRGKVSECQSLHLLISLECTDIKATGWPRDDRSVRALPQVAARGHLHDARVRLCDPAAPGRRPRQDRWGEDGV